ncbi:MAG: hypothetical protein D6782_03845, partial [Alphaproteobacteria bacterium]
MTGAIDGAIDIVVNLFTPETVAAGQTGFDAAFMDQVRMPLELRGGVRMDDFLRMMDQAGIAHALLIAVRAGPQGWRHSFEIPYADVAECCSRHPDRFSALAGVDPTRGMQQLRDLEHAVCDLGFIGAHFYPHWFRLPPDRPQCYPIYAKCCELGIPIMMQV